MRAVALSDRKVQAKIGPSFVPLKVAIPPGAKTLPVDWPGIRHWRVVYQVMGGEGSEGFTCCTVVSPDLETEYGSTGSAHVWELFDSIAYDAEKFAAMLDRAKDRAAREREIRTDRKRTEWQRKRDLATFRRQMRREIREEGRFRLPPHGFTADAAVELFQLSGDLPAPD